MTTNFHRRTWSAASTGFGTSWIPNKEGTNGYPRVKIFELMDVLQKYLYPWIFIDKIFAK
jgi:hypothetical protein